MISGKLVTVVITLTVGGVLMLGYLHYRGVSIKQQEQAQCVQGDRDADKAAADAQHAADLASNAQLREQLRRAQVEADMARQAAGTAQRRADKLSAAMEILHATDKSAATWLDTPIPESVRREIGK